MIICNKNIFNDDLVPYILTSKKVFITRFEETGYADIESQIKNPKFVNLLKQKEKKGELQFKDIYDWPTYFIWLTIYYTHIIKNKNNVKHHFLTFNNANHYHRCKALNILDEKGLLNKNNYTWFNDKSKGPYCTSLEYNALDKAYMVGDCLTQYNITDIYFGSSFQVVIESQCNEKATFLTEKTFIPIFCKKPCFILSNYRHWDYMRQLGFKDYPVFDYTFDDIADNEKRIETYCSAVQNVCKKYTPAQIQKLCQSVADYNYRRLLEICSEKIFKPKWATPENFHKSQVQELSMIMGAEEKAVFLLREDGYYESK